MFITKHKFEISAGPGPTLQPPAGPHFGHRRTPRCRRPLTLRVRLRLSHRGTPGARRHTGICTHCLPGFKLQGATLQWARRRPGLAAAAGTARVTVQVAGPGVSHVGSSCPPRLAGRRGCCDLDAVYARGPGNLNHWQPEARDSGSDFQAQAADSGGPLRLAGHCQGQTRTRSESDTQANVELEVTVAEALSGAMSPGPGLGGTCTSTSLPKVCRGPA